MNTQKDKSYQDRLKKMKESIDKNQDILDSDFPDEVTFSGNPELLDKEEDEIDVETNNSEDDKSCQKKEK